jgi:hypothetical protein
MSRPALSVRLTALVLAISLLTAFSPPIEANDLSRGQSRATVAFATSAESNIDGDRFVRCAFESGTNVDFIFPLKRSLSRSFQLTYRPFPERRKLHQLNEVFLI